MGESLSKIPEHGGNLVAAQNIPPGGKIATTLVESHPGPTCGICCEKVKGFHFKCLYCSNFDLCAGCEVLAHHGQHPMLQFPSSENSPQRIICFIGSCAVPDYPSVQQQTHRARDFDTLCDKCGVDIVKGVMLRHFKCLVCPNYHLCAACGPKNNHTQHPIMRLPTADVIPTRVECEIGPNSVVVTRRFTMHGTSEAVGDHEDPFCDSYPAPSPQYESEKPEGKGSEETLYSEPWDIEDNSSRYYCKDEHNDHRLVEPRTYYNIKYWRGNYCSHDCAVCNYTGYQGGDHSNYEGGCGSSQLDNYNCGVP